MLLGKLDSRIERVLNAQCAQMAAEGAMPRDLDVLFARILMRLEEAGRDRGAIDDERSSLGSAYYAMWIALGSQ